MPIIKDSKIAYTQGQHNLYPSSSPPSLNTLLQPPRLDLNPRNIVPPPIPSPLQIISITTHNPHPPTLISPLIPQNINIHRRNIQQCTIILYPRTPKGRSLLRQRGSPALDAGDIVVAGRGVAVVWVDGDGGVPEGDFGAVARGFGEAVGDYAEGGVVGGGLIVGLDGAIGLGGFGLLRKGVGGGEEGEEGEEEGGERGEVVHGDGDEGG